MRGPQKIKMLLRFFVLPVIALTSEKTDLYADCGGISHIKKKVKRKMLKLVDYC